MNLLKFLIMLLLFLGCTSALYQTVSHNNKEDINVAGAYPIVRSDIGIFEDSLQKT